MVSLLNVCCIRLFTSCSFTHTRTRMENLKHTTIQSPQYIGNNVRVYCVFFLLVALLVSPSETWIAWWAGLLRTMYIVAVCIVHIFECLYVCFVFVTVSVQSSSPEPIRIDRWNRENNIQRNWLYCWHCCVILWGSVTYVRNRMKRRWKRDWKEEKNNLE